jgi:hypothetical protein
MNNLRIAARCGILAWAALCMQAGSASAADPLADIRAFRTSHASGILEQYVEFLKIPNVASDRANIRRNAEAIVAMMQRLNLSPRLRHRWSMANGKCRKPGGRWFFMHITTANRSIRPNGSLDRSLLPCGRPR